MPWNPKEPLTAWNYPPCAACDEGCEGTPCTCGDGPTSEDDHQRIVALESQLQAAQQAAIERGNQLLERGNEVMALTAQLAEANERCAGLAAALEQALRLGREMAGFVKPYGLDDYGPRSEYSRWSICRTLIGNSHAPSAILAAVREKAKREGAVEEEVRLRRKVETLTYEEACMASDIFCRSLSDRDERMKRAGAVEALKVVRDYLSWQGAIEGGEDVISRNYRFVCNRIAELEAEG